MIYRVATHELGGLHLLPLFDTKISLKQLYDMVEMCDVHDTLKKIAHEQALAEAKSKQKNKQ